MGKSGLATQSTVQTMKEHTANSSKVAGKINGNSVLIGQVKLCVDYYALQPNILAPRILLLPWKVGDIQVCFLDLLTAWTSK
jgi:hypothetical protein